MILPRQILIAIVDDEESVRKAIERLLRSAGMEARGFATGGGFLESLDHFHPDCLVLDLHMPDMSGFEVMARLEGRVPFVVITVSAALSQLDPVLARAAASLGANRLTAFFRVTMPLIMSGIVSGAIFAFTTSFDEVVVAILLTGPEQRTLPRQLLSGTKENLDPTVMAAATVLIAISAILLLIVTGLQQRAKRLAERTL